MEDNKYFKPNIEDIHVGYECEIRKIASNVGIYRKMLGEEDIYQTFYTPIIVGKEYPIPESNEFTIDKLDAVLANWYNDNPSIFQAIELLKKGKLKTPYLTKEQIEYEGWRQITNGIGNVQSHFDNLNKEEFLFFIKNGYLLDFSLKDNYIHIQYISGVYPLISVFRGEIKSINEFRKIMKLLNIK